MSEFPGNPYGYQSAVNNKKPELEDAWGIAQALMAIAFEQRTANLQTERAWSASQGDGDTHYGLNDKIQKRLGAAR